MKSVKFSGLIQKALVSALFFSGMSMADEEEDARIIKALTEASKARTIAELETLQEAVSSINRDDRSEASRILARLELLDLNEVQVRIFYLELLDQNNSTLKSEAISKISGLADIPDESTKKIKAIAFDKTEVGYVRRAAILFIGDKSSPSSDDAEELLDLIDSQGVIQSVALAALEALGEIGIANERIVGGISDVLSGATPEMQIQAARTLHRITEQAGPDLLATYGVNSNSELSGFLGQNTDGESMMMRSDASQIFRNSSEIYIRALVVDYLIEQRDTGPESILIYGECLESDNADLQRAGKDGLSLLEKLDENQFEALSSVYKSRYYRAASAACRVLIRFEIYNDDVISTAISHLLSNVEFIPLLDVGIHLNLLRIIENVEKGEFRALLPLIEERNKIYKGRAKEESAYLKGYILLTLLDLGFGDELVDVAADGIVNSDQSMAFLFAASSRVFVENPPEDAAEYLSDILNAVKGDLSSRWLILDGKFGELAIYSDSATSCQIEAIRAVGVISPVTQETLEVLRSVISSKVEVLPDPKAVAGEVLGNLK